MQQHNTRWPPNHQLYHTNVAIRTLATPITPRRPRARACACTKCPAGLLDPCNCTVFGPVQCAGGRITQLNLIGQGLAGPLAAFATSVFDLTGLVFLGLQNNQLTGPLSPAVSKLTGLIGLSLGGNGLTSTIPNALYELTDLTSLNLGSNYLSGTISATLAQLTGMKGLDLGTNALSGTLPHVLNQLTDLDYLEISSNAKITGALPAFNFSQISNCCMMGYIPFVCPLPPGAQGCVGGPGCGSQPPPTCT